jgi:hypothetical protein
VHPAPHPDIASIAFLLGTWRGHGRGGYPTIQPFGYDEEVSFTHAGKPFLAYVQKTRATDDGRPLHAESGYWRPQPDGGLEVILAHPFGVTEIEIGTVAGRRVELVSRSLVCSPSAKEIHGVERSFFVADDLLTYDVRMAAVGNAMAHHLHAELRKVG